MKNRIPTPNPAVIALLKSPEIRALMFSKAETAKAIYQGVVTKRTGRLARSARTSTFLGGPKNDRWIGRLTAAEDYAASHEFGTDNNMKGSHDLNQVLNRMARS